MEFLNLRDLFHIIGYKNHKVKCNCHFLLTELKSNLSPNEIPFIPLKMRHSVATFEGISMKKKLAPRRKWTKIGNNYMKSEMSFANSYTCYKNTRAQKFERRIN